MLKMKVLKIPASARFKIAVLSVGIFKDRLLPPMFTELAVHGPLTVMAP
jgi:hypothetical protein